MFRIIFAAFPDLRITVHELLQEGDKVTARVTFGGTHQGEFMGVPASGKRVEWNAIGILEFRGTMALAHWGVMDMAGAISPGGTGRTGQVRSGRQMLREVK